MSFRGVTQLTCAVCGKGFNSLSKLTRHAQRKHAAKNVIGMSRRRGLSSSNALANRPCLYCGAGTGEPCMTARGGRTKRLHAGR